MDINVPILTDKEIVCMSNLMTFSKERTQNSNLGNMKPETKFLSNIVLVKI